LPRKGEASDRLAQITPEAVSFMMSAIGSRGGSVTGGKKAEAARANAVKARAKRWNLKEEGGNGQK